jgi:hypothetical protein
MRKGTSGLGREAGAGNVDLGFGEGDIGGGRIRREKIGEEERGLITPKSRDHCSTSQCGSRVSIRKSKKEKLIFSTTELSQVLVDYALENLIEWWSLI